MTENTLAIRTPSWVSTGETMASTRKTPTRMELPLCKQNRHGGRTKSTNVQRRLTHCTQCVETQFTRRVETVRGRGALARRFPDLRSPRPQSARARTSMYPRTRVEEVSDERFEEVATTDMARNARRALKMCGLRGDFLFSGGLWGSPTHKEEAV